MRSGENSEWRQNENDDEENDEDDDDDDDDDVNQAREPKKSRSTENENRGKYLNNSHTKDPELIYKHWTRNECTEYHRQIIKSIKSLRQQTRS